MIRRHALTCGCTYLSDTDWTPCAIHSEWTLAQVKRAEVEVEPTMTCPSCGADKYMDVVCEACGV